MQVDYGSEGRLGWQGRMNTGMSLVEEDEECLGDTQTCSLLDARHCTSCQDKRVN